MNQKQVKQYLREIIKMRMISMVEAFGFTEAQLDAKGILEDFKGECYLIEKQLLPQINEIPLNTIMMSVDVAGSNFINNYLKDEIALKEMSDFFKNNMNIEIGDSVIGSEIIDMFRFTSIRPDFESDIDFNMIKLVPLNERALRGFQKGKIVNIYDEILRR